ncbi:MAG TPA: CDP-alcohol phosphatidyltransferase family protein [Flavobacterium sp.]|jgi:CDP-diacylglycerol--serine O-phosphatidyltransferase
MRLKQHVPNIITLLNLASGCVALIFAFEGVFLYAFYFVALGIFFDFFDGFFARLYKVSGQLGAELDSLADMVTSGVVPGIVMYKMLLNTVPGYNWNPILPYLGFIITLGSCYRLAKFNIDTRQSDSFIGLPTPANALFVLSLPLVLAYTDSLLILEVLTNPYVLLAITLLSAYLLNAEIPLFSLKVKKFSLRANSIQVIFLILSLLLLVFFRFLGVPLLILLYVLMSVITNKAKK